MFSLTSTAQSADSAAAAPTNTSPTFVVRAYEIRGNTLLSTNVLIPLLSRYTGTNVSLEDVVQAASDLHDEYRKAGYPMMSVAISQEPMVSGTVTMNVFETAIPQVVVSGRRYAAFTNAQEMATAQENAAQGSVTATNAGPFFEVRKYTVMGNSVLPPETIGKAISEVSGAYGTNVSFDGIRSVVEGLQQAYNERGYATVAVGIPQQKLTNATVKLQVTEGWLAAIHVTGNRYFSANNVMRALPGLHTNMLLNAPIFQAELNRANGNRDRQIYPLVGPGPDPGTSELTLTVKDRLPFHAKLEFNNQNSPGTPRLRLNASAMQDNLWQLEHTLGVQYSFSPEEYKSGQQWNFYDAPLVANYSAFYRMPLGNPEAIANKVTSDPGSFGYNEATRKFSLPPPIGQPELTFYASGSTIDTDVETLSSRVILDVPGVRQIVQNYVQQDLTWNYDIGTRFSSPLEASAEFHSDFSGGLDYKTYKTSTAATNIFQISEITLNDQGLPNPPRVSTVASEVPFTVSRMEYLPISLRGNAAWKVPLGNVAFGLGLGANLWFDSRTAIGRGTNTTHSDGDKSLQQITASTQSSGYWVVLNPSLSYSFEIFTNWTTIFRADGQWASEPLISNERFGAGGVNSVRGYHEGEEFGDTGWHLTLEQQTPPHVVGMVRSNTPLTIRGSVYMDYARVYLLDPGGLPASTPLWGTGFGVAASVGSHWRAQFLFSWPLLDTVTTQAELPFFNFALTGEF